MKTDRNDDNDDEEEEVDEFEYKNKNLWHNFHDKQKPIDQ